MIDEIAPFSVTSVKRVRVRTLVPPDQDVLEQRRDRVVSVLVRRVPSVVVPLELPAHASTTRAGSR